MFKNLNTNAIGVQSSLTDALDLAKAHGFAGIDFSIEEAVELAESHGVDWVRHAFQAAGVRPGSWNFPVKFRGDDAPWQTSLAALPSQAELAYELGCFRTATWIMPGDDERDFYRNFDFHVERLAPAAEILAEYGQRLGLEFVGPKTLRDASRFPFIHTMAGMLELCDTIGTGNVGLLVDSYHLYTSHGTVDELRDLANWDVVVVHINDAPAGVPVDEQLDQVRALPGETGVLDLTGFLQALKSIGYDGPVTVEPFSQRLRELSAERAVQETATALDSVWTAAGLSNEKRAP